MQLKVTKYQLYVLIYHLFFIGYVINASIFRQEFFLVYLVFISFIELSFLKKNNKYVLLLGSLAVFSMFTFVMRNFYQNATLSLYFLFMPILILAYKEKYIGYKIQLIPLCIYLCYVFVRIVQGVDFNFMLDGRSRNMVSLYCLIFTIYYYIEKYRYKGTLDFLPAFVCLFISLLAIGRSGIITATMLFVLVSYFKFRESSVSKKIKYLSIALFSVLAFFLVFKEYIIAFVQVALFRFQDMGIESGPREAMIEKYNEHITTRASDLFLGVPIRDHIFKLFDYNLHNSFLSLHYFTGIFSLIVFGLIIRALIFTKGKFFFKGLLVILLLRGLTDQIFFFNFNDIIVFYLLFLIIGKDKVAKDFIKTYRR